MSATATEAPVTTEAPKLDPVSAYEAEVQRMLSTPTPEGFVDPHVEELQAREAGDVDPQIMDDVDPEHIGSSGPTDAELAAGENDQPTDIDLDAPSVTEKAPQYRTRPVDDIEKRAFELRKGNPDKPLQECLDEARAELTQAAEPEVTLPTPQALADERKELDKEWRRAVRELASDEDIQELEARIAEIDDQLPKAAEQHQRAAQREAERFQEYANRTVELYPDAAVEGSPLYERMEAIHQTMEANGDSTIHAPNKALVIAQMAARELSIAPKTPGKAGASTTGAPGQPRQAATAQPRARGHAPMTAPLASPGARTTTTGPTSFDKQIAAVNTPEGYETLMRSLVRGRR